MKKLAFLVLLALVMLPLVATGASAATAIAPVRYEAVVLPADFNPLALNNDGVVAGQLAHRSENKYEAAVWKDGVLTPLGYYGGVGAAVLDLNDNGSMLVEVFHEEGTHYWSDFLLITSNGQTEIKGTIDQDDKITHVFLRKLNNLDQAVGYTTDQFGPSRGLIWQKNARVIVDTDKFCWLGLINDQGCAVGYGPDPNSDPVYPSPTPVVFRNSALLQLETPVGTGFVTAINNKGLIVGSYDTDETHTTPGSFRPALWSENGKLVALKNRDVNGSAIDINNRDETIGHLDQKPVFWKNPEANPVFLDPIAPIRLDSVMYLNDAGQILGFGEGGKCFLLTLHNRRR